MRKAIKRIGLIALAALVVMAAGFPLYNVFTGAPLDVADKVGIACAYGFFLAQSLAGLWEYGK